MRFNLQKCNMFIQRTAGATCKIPRAIVRSLRRIKEALSLHDDRPCPLPSFTVYEVKWGCPLPHPNHSKDAVPASA
jgi:hypothetical protein